MPYEDNEIFSYLDNQEVPPVLMEVLEQTQVSIISCSNIHHRLQYTDYSSPLNYIDTSKTVSNKCLDAG